MPDCRIKIGGLVIALHPDEDQGNFSIPKPYNKFLSEDNYDIEIQVHRDKLPNSDNWKLSFKTKGPTSYYFDNHHWIVSVQRLIPGASPHLVAIFDNNNRKGAIFDLTPQQESGMLPFPLRYPIGQVLIADMLSKGRGLIVHASGIATGRSGLLFVGTSGAGKSTIARLFMERKGVILLNDDRIILRRENGLVYMHGTPWHGEIKEINPLVVPLEKIYILNQAKHNRVIPLKPSEAVSALFVRSFPTFWNQSGLDFNLDFISELVNKVQCYQLDFLPEKELVNFLI
jgi:hypothetical protein